MTWNKWFYVTLSFLLFTLFRIWVVRVGCCWVMKWSQSSDTIHYSKVRHCTYSIHYCIRYCTYSKHYCLCIPLFVSSHLPCLLLHFYPIFEGTLTYLLCRLLTIVLIMLFLFIFWFSYNLMNFTSSSFYSHHVT